MHGGAVVTSCMARLTTTEGNNNMNKFLTVGAALFAPALAFAEVPASVTSAIATTQADSTAVAGLMIGVTAALLVFKYIRRLMK